LVVGFLTKQVATEKIELQTNEITANWMYVGHPYPTKGRRSLHCIETEMQKATKQEEEQTTFLVSSHSQSNSPTKRSH
jgi:hypothetical protein